MVIATENPIEEEGTFNLPEAQMDRFMMKAVMTLSFARRRGSDAGHAHPPRLRLSDRSRLPLQPANAFRRPTLIFCARRHAACMFPTRSCVMRSISPPRHEVPAPAPSRDCRPWCFGCLAARHHRLDPYRPGEGVAVRARLCGAQDLKAFAHEVLRHRIMLTFEALADGVVSDQIVDKIVETVPVP